MKLNGILPVNARDAAKVFKLNSFRRCNVLANCIVLLLLVLQVYHEAIFANAAELSTPCTPEGCVMNERFTLVPKLHHPEHFVVAPDAQFSVKIDMPYADMIVSEQLTRVDPEIKIIETKEIVTTEQHQGHSSYPVTTQLGDFDMTNPDCGMTKGPDELILKYNLAGRSAMCFRIRVTLVNHQHCYKMIPGEVIVPVHINGTDANGPFFLSRSMTVGSSYVSDNYVLKLNGGSEPAMKTTLLCTDSEDSEKFSILPLTDSPQDGLIFTTSLLSDIKMTNSLISSIIHLPAPRALVLNYDTISNHNNEVSGHVSIVYGGTSYSVSTSSASGPTSPASYKSFSGTFSGFFSGVCTGDPTFAARDAGLASEMSGTNGMACRSSSAQQSSQCLRFYIPGSGWCTWWPSDFESVTVNGQTTLRVKRDDLNYGYSDVLINDKPYGMMVSSVGITFHVSASNPSVLREVSRTFSKPDRVFIKFDRFPELSLDLSITFTSKDFEHSARDVEIEQCIYTPEQVSVVIKGKKDTYVVPTGYGIEGKKILLTETPVSHTVKLFPAGPDGNSFGQIRHPVFGNAHCEPVVLFTNHKNLTVYGAESLSASVIPTMQTQGLSISTPSQFDFPDLTPPGALAKIKESSIYQGIHRFTTAVEKAFKIPGEAIQKTQETLSRLGAYANSAFAGITRSADKFTDMLGNYFNMLLGSMPYVTLIMAFMMIIAFFCVVSYLCGPTLRLWSFRYHRRQVSLKNDPRTDAFFLKSRDIPAWPMLKLFGYTNEDIKNIHALKEQ